MYKVGDYLIYRRDVVEVVEIKKKYFKNTDYYVLIPLKDKSLKMQVPVDSELIRELIDKKTMEKIIRNIPNIGVIEIPGGNDKFLEGEYKNLLSTNNHEDLIKILKTTYYRNQARLDKNKKIGDKDDNYFKLAEELLLNEFSIVLGKNFEDTKNYVIDKVTKLIEKAKKINT